MGSSQSSNHDKDDNLTAILTLLFMVFTLLWYLWIWKKPSRSPSPSLPPGPRGLPLLGYLPFLGANLVKQVVRDQDTTISDRDPTIAATIVSYGASDIAFESYGSDWRKLRKVFVSQMLSKTNLDDCYALRKEEMHKSISHIYHDQIGTPTDLGQVTYSTAMNSTTRMLWGATLQGTDLGEGYRKLVAEMMDLLVKPNISDYLPAVARYDIQGIEKQAKKVHYESDKILSWATEEQMKNRGFQQQERKDFLQFLLDNNDNRDDGSTSLTMQQLKALLMDIAVGATLPLTSDTTATTIEWVMTELMQHPDEMRRNKNQVTLLGRTTWLKSFICRSYIT